MRTYQESAVPNSELRADMAADLRFLAVGVVLVVALVGGVAGLALAVFG